VTMATQDSEGAVEGSATESGELGDAPVEAARRGSPRAFADLISRYDVRLRGLAYRLLQDQEAMQDAMQDAYVAAFRGLPAFRGDAAVETWLYRIVYTTCLRHISRRRDPHVVYGAETAASAADPADGVALRQDIATALSHLPVDQRAAVLLVDGQGFSYKEAGEVFGVPSGTVASRLSCGRASLRAMLGIAHTVEVARDAAVKR